MTSFHGPEICLLSLRVSDVKISYLWIMNQYDQKFDLKLNVSHSGLRFTVQKFCLISRRVLDV